jgi:hypothetical protein
MTSGRTDNLYLRLRALVQFVEAGRASIELLSDTERLAVSLVLDRAEWLQRESHPSLSAAAHIGTEWTQAAIAVQRDGWQPLHTQREVIHG